MRRTMAFFFAFGVIFGASLVGANGCKGLVRGKAQDAVNGILPDYLGAAEKYTTKVDASSGAVLRGHLSHVHIEGTKVQLSPDLTADGLTLDLHEVSVDTRKKSLKSVESVRFTVTMTPDTLNKYVRTLRPDIRDLRVTTNDEGITVRARPELLGYPTLPVSVSGRLAPVGAGSKLNFSPTGGRVSVVPVAGQIVSWLLRSLNPAVDLTTMRVPVQIETVETDLGGIRLSGNVRPEDLLRAQKNP